MMRRRSFLALMGAAPIAAPVIAREAAAKAGVAAMPMPSFDLAEGASVGMAGDSGLPWLVERLRDLYEPEAFSKALEAVGKPRLLDPDLASSRSFSLSAAMNIQRRRDAAKRLESARRDALSDFKQSYGVEWRGLAAWLARPLERRP